MSKQLINFIIVAAIISTFTIGICLILIWCGVLVKYAIGVGSGALITLFITALVMVVHMAVYFLKQDKEGKP